MKFISIYGIEYSLDALDYLKNGQWPGNIRQLKNCIERASVFADHYWISKTDLSQISAFTSRRTAVCSSPTDDSDEKTNIERVLQKMDANRTKTAEKLGISTVTLWRKMKKYNITL